MKEILLMCFAAGWYARYVQGSDRMYRYAGLVFKGDDIG